MPTSSLMSQKQRREMVRLLKVLDGFLSTSIEGELVPGTGEPNPANQQEVYRVTRDRRDLEASKKLARELLGK